ncbi:MAG TPA: hypothetical protein VLI90_05285 [Tepidisphaeraceae bacterium]|nr:hypothetical protein [Tepidisphaeraceae bacterium]
MLNFEGVVRGEEVNNQQSTIHPELVDDWGVKGTRARNVTTQPSAFNIQQSL